MLKVIKVLRDKRGEGYIDVTVILLIAMLVVTLGMKVLPVFIAKNELNTFANELARVAEIEGQIGIVTNAKAHELEAVMNIEPTITWSRVGKVQLNDDFTVIVTTVMDIGFFEFGSFPITLTAKASGRSETYWK